MKRDDEYIRDLMLEIEAQDDPLYMCQNGLGMSAEQTREYYHLRLLADAGLVEETGKYGGVFRMTNAGHDFLAAIRSETSWNRVKATAATVSGAGIGVLRDIALGYVRQELTKLGIPLG